MDDNHGNQANRVTGHFGREMRKDRIARGWDLRELSRRTKIDFGHLSKIENGKRPPTVRVATAMDLVFSERRGWYVTWVEDMRRAPEIPATFKDWADFEDRCRALRCWTPGLVNGLAQTREYAEAVIATETGLDDRAKRQRLDDRMARQRRILGRARPPLVTLLVDLASLYRLVGTNEVMSAEMRHLVELAALPGVVLQVAPEVGHASMVSEYLIADDAVWSESTYSGGTFTDDQTVADAALRFATLQSECYRAGESLALLEEMERAWTGGNPRTVAVPEGRA